MLKEPYFNHQNRNIRLYIPALIPHVEEIILQFCKEYRFLTIPHMARLLEADEVRILDSIRLGKLQTYSVTLEKQIIENQFVTHASPIHTIISFDDFVSFMIDECHLTYTSFYWYQDDDVEPLLAGDMCYRKYSPKKQRIFVHPVISNRKDTIEFLLRVANEEVKLQSLSAIRYEPEMLKSTKNGDPIPYGDTSIMHLGMVANQLKWMYPTTKEKNNPHKTHKRREVVRLIGDSNHYKCYHDLISQTNRSLLYLRPLPGIHCIQSHIEPHFMSLTHAKVKYPHKDIGSEQCDTLIPNTFNLLSSLYINTHKNRLV